MHTHYDNLKVSRDAPSEVIRAAYKSLSQKYHPDRHADAEEANRIMRLLNAAYEVLSDPVKREEHDRWIATQEKLEAAQRSRRPPPRGAAAGVPPRPGTGTPPPAGTRARPQPQPQAQAQARQDRARKPEPERTGRSERAERPERSERSRPEAERARQRAEAGDQPMREDGFRPARISGRSWSYLVYGLVIAAIVILLSDWVPTTSSAAPTPDATQAIATDTVPTAPATSIVSTREETRYIRPTLTPKGDPWPERSGYLPGYPVLRTDGLSMLTVDNTRNKSDVFLKLVSTDTARPLPVRTSYVRSGTSFTMENIAPGNYDVRYRSLDTGEIFKSERFELKEIQEATGTSFAKNILTLYSVEGKARNVSIPEREFP